MKRLDKELERVCKENGFPIIEAFQTAADAIAEDMAKNPDAINNVAPGWLMWLHDCGFKCCNDTIGSVIRETAWEEVNNADYALKRRLYLIEAVVDMTDEDLQLFPYGHQVPDGAGRGGSRWYGKGSPDLAIWKKAGKPEKDFYDQFVGLVTLLRSPHYCLAIDPEGHDYCRYIMMLPNWREIFADDYADAIQEMKAEKEAEQAAELQRQAAAALEYSRDCAKIESWCKPVDGLPRNKQTAAAGRNIKNVLSHLFPGLKFKVSHAGGWGDHFTVQWEDGPTVQTVENACNWSVFCGWVASFDGMTDSDVSHSAAFTRFAKTYGGEHLSDIQFSRSQSQATCAELVEFVRQRLTAAGIDPEKDYNERDPEAARILSAFPGLISDDSRRGWYWINSERIGQMIFDNITY